MLLKSEYSGSSILAFITPYSFKDAEAIVQGMGQYMHISILPVYKFSIHPDFFCFFQNMLLLKTEITKMESQLPPPKGGGFEFGCKPTIVMQLLNLPPPPPPPPRGGGVYIFSFPPPVGGGEVGGGVVLLHLDA